MSERDKLSFNEGEEEEFHITDEDIDRELAAMDTDHSSGVSGEASAEESIEKPAKKGRFATLKQLKRKHWIIIIVIAVILLFGLMKFIGGRQSEASFDQITPVSTSPSASKIDTKKPDADLTKTLLQPSTPVTTTSVPASAPVSASAPLLPTPTLATSAAATSKTDLTAVVSNETKLTQALEAIQQQNQMLTQQLTALSGRVVGLESTLSQSNRAVEDLSQQLEASKKAEAPAAPLPQLAQVPTGPQYTVEAVVPQRAWLQAGDGSTMTVMMGDDIPGLGAVVSIDPYSGNVTTASGTVIKYGS